MVSIQRLNLLSELSDVARHFALILKEPSQPLQQSPSVTSKTGAASACDNKTPLVMVAPAPIRASKVLKRLRFHYLSPVQPIFFLCLWQQNTACNGCTCPHKGLKGTKKITVPLFEPCSTYILKVQLSSIFAKNSLKSCKHMNFLKGRWILWTFHTDFFSFFEEGGGGGCGGVVYWNNI